MLTSGKYNDEYAYDEEHIRYVVDPLVEPKHGASFALFKDEEVKAFMFSRVTTVAEHFKIPLIPDYEQYFLGKNPDPKYQERIATNIHVREAINTDAWIRENLTPEEKIMFMRI